MYSGNMQNLARARQQSTEHFQHRRMCPEYVRTKLSQLAEKRRQRAFGQMSAGENQSAPADCVDPERRAIVRGWLDGVGSQHSDARRAWIAVKRADDPIENHLLRYD